MHAGGLIAEIYGSNAPTYHLTDLSGMVTGTNDFDVFGDVRAQTGVTSIFDFTGEQRDTVTGMTCLRARYYEPGYGRFLSADTVQPNAPGKQGYNRCTGACPEPAEGSRTIRCAAPTRPGIRTAMWKLRFDCSWGYSNRSY